MTERASASTATRLDRFAAVTVLLLLGVTWPVLDLLANNAEFFLARRSPKVEMALAGLLLAVGLPLLGGWIGSFTGKVGSAVGNTLMFVAGASLSLLYVRRLPIGWVWATAISLVLAMLGGFAFTRSAQVRLFLRYLSPAPIVLLLIFWFGTPVGALLADTGQGLGTAADVSGPIPVVMVVFDEFPVASLIDPSGNLRTDRYPNFAKLAADGTWFRNAVTIEQQTEHSVPAILTGTIPAQSLTPFAGQYPDNLFTALQETYVLQVDETITQLCPVALCESVAVTSTPLARDIGVVAGHVLLPEGLTGNLPTIATSWGDFEAAVTDFDVVSVFRDQIDHDARQPIIDLVANLKPIGAKPPLYFTHVIVPHHPWQFLPDGRRYLLNEERAPGSVSPGWGEDDWLVSQAMQRHLLQVAYADEALGEIMDQMKAKGIYENAMLIVVADHGITVRPGVAHQRQIEADTVGSVAAIPLFIKAPGHPGGVIEDRRAETIDILPTIADVIGANLAWEIDGASLFGPEPIRAESTTVGPHSEVTYGVSGKEKLEVAAMIEAWMPGGDPWALVPPGAVDVRGDRPDPETPASETLRVFIDRSNWYRAVDVGSDVVPARITGRIIGLADRDLFLAVAVNGTIGAVTRTFVEDGFTGFQAMLPPHLFVDGNNEIQIYEVAESGSLLRIP